MMVLVCPERSAAEWRATVCAGKLTIIAIMLFAVAKRGFQGSICNYESEVLLHYFFYYQFRMYKALRIKILNKAWFFPVHWLLQ